MKTDHENQQSLQSQSPNETRTRDLLLTRQALCHLSHATIDTRYRPNETRTRDLLLTRQALCHLSHATIDVPTRLELVISCLLGRRFAI
ncbi:hypothetical protein OUZ56_024337 [Daphnia magna]|uniref:Uncharacterized protein n=1 Tax=Daphnia magna TaxID=35525 RepID=A0ABR0B0L3_9CRUS|nr:hypothetical protein OUZ56_024317 [Daphnia magna]KAK4030931.1 hypothetical protein OUZ56_024337 [Daphnia magna]